MTSITCPRCGATITARGVSHSGQPEGQWECGCGCVVDGAASPNHWTEREAQAAPHCQTRVPAEGDLCDDCEEREFPPDTAGRGFPCLWCLRRVNERPLRLCGGCQAEYERRAAKMPQERAGRT